MRTFDTPGEAIFQGTQANELLSRTMSTAPSRTGPRPGTTNVTPKQATAALPAQSQSAPAARRAQPSRSAATSIFEDASAAIGNLEAAYRFLTERELVPALHREGGDGEDISGACTTHGLIAGLQHFARATPDKALAAKGLLAFALYAEAAIATHSAAELAAPISEAVQTAIKDCLDGHVDRMENSFLSAAEKLDKAAGKLKSEAGGLQAAGESLARAETKLAAAERALTQAKEAYDKDWPPLPSTQGPGAPPASNRSPPSATPPAQAQRALVNRDLLSRQLLVRGVALRDQQGATLSNAAAKAKGKLTLELMAKEQGLRPPQEAEIVDVKILHEDVVYTFSTREAAVWLLEPDVARAFATRMGDKAQVVARRFKVIAEMVPISFDPTDGAALRQLQETHGLLPRAITRADWIKAPYRRAPGQRFAHLLMEFEDDDQANVAIGGLRIAGRKVLVRRNIDEPRRCLSLPPMPELRRPHRT